MQLILSLLALLFLYPTLAQAEYCVLLKHECTEGPETRTIDGRQKHSDCWAYKDEYKCFGGEQKNNCDAIEKTAGCNIKAQECTELGTDGICNNYRKVYNCGVPEINKLVEGTVILDSQYTILKDEEDLEECKPNQTSPDCYEIEKVCVEGTEERIINGKAIHKDCWKHEVKYNCFAGNEISDCDEYKKRCKEISTNCLSTNKNGTCRHTEYKYKCEESSTKANINMNCKTAGYCIGGNCETAEYQPNKNFGRAVSALNLLKNLQGQALGADCNEDNTKECKIFSGSHHTCKINILGSLNCCKDSGWLKGMGLGSCGEEEKILAKKKSNRLCHEVGTYCSAKVVGKCLRRKRSYCCFDSKLSRLVHEQGRPQIGVSWGNAESPNCAPLTIEQLQAIDFSKIDFTELYADIAANAEKLAHTPFDDRSFAEMQKNEGHINNKTVNEEYQKKYEFQGKTMGSKVSNKFRRHYE